MRRTHQIHQQYLNYSAIWCVRRTLHDLCLEKLSCTVRLPESGFSRKT
ncbi:hypothetical protein [Alysiella crassa]|nr:hypothetical protein [Alysiella crassa]UOP06034.1 hypothetical protein LVJ80_09255 [Alysiella crassa]